MGGGCHRLVSGWKWEGQRLVSGWVERRWEGLRRVSIEGVSGRWLCNINLVTLLIPMFQEASRNVISSGGWTPLRLCMSKT